MSDWLPVLSLFTSSFLSATLLPGSSEAVLAGLLLAGNSSPWLLVITASIGNSLGGLTNVILGRLFPLRKTSHRHDRALQWLNRFGPVTLLLSWLPLIGDLLCLMAGWLRMSWGPVVLWLCLGKALRYVFIMLVTVQGMAWWQG